VPARHPASRQRQNATIPAGTALQTSDGRSPGLYPACTSHELAQSTAPLPSRVPKGPVATPNRAGAEHDGYLQLRGQRRLCTGLPFSPRSGAPSSIGMMCTKTLPIQGMSHSGPAWLRSMNRPEEPYPALEHGARNMIDPQGGLAYFAIYFLSQL
jgi:hypothetical protein